MKSVKTGASSGTEKTLTIQRRAECPKQAATLGRAELRKANLEEQTSTIETMGSPRLAAGQTIQHEGFGKFSGKYFIKSPTHRFSGAYSTSFELATPSPADLYKARWQIEVFFKELKQYLTIKKFVGTNEKAVKIQIYTALIVYLLLALQKFLEGSTLIMQNF